MEPRQFSPSRVVRETVGRENSATILEDNLTIPRRAENAHTHPSHPQSPVLGTHLPHMHRETCTRRFTETLSVIMKNYNTLNVHQQEAKEKLL